MKARRKGTNELFKEIESVTFVGSTEHLYNVSAKDVEFEQYPNQFNLEEGKLKHLETIRQQAAIAAMQSIIPTQGGKYMLCDAHKKYDDCTNEAIKYADALVKKLKGE